MDEGDLIAGRYRLLRPIGSGATGTVWAARHELLEREFALKIAAERRGVPEHQSREARALFLREVRIVGKLRHPNIVDIADAGELAPGHGLYLAMELLLGESLAQRIAAGPLAAGDALSVLAQVCRALATTHAAGVIHRDIKPENIFLARGAAGGVVPKLLDFGVSSAQGMATLGGRIIGTPAYMSPEQALGENVIDCRTDVWAIGVVLYEMLTGRHPFAAPTYPALLPLIIEAPYAPLPTTIPQEARTVVAGCLAKDRADRYATADALVAAIDRALATLSTPGGTSGTSVGFFVETGVGVPTSSRGEADAAARSTARRTLALAIFAVPVLIGLAAAASSFQRRRGAALAAAAGSMAPLPAAPGTALAAPDASASAAPPTLDAGSPVTPASARLPGGPRPRGRAVTRVNNAGF